MWPFPTFSSKGPTLSGSRNLLPGEGNYVFCDSLESWPLVPATGMSARSLGAAERGRGGPAVENILPDPAHVVCVSLLRGHREPWPQISS